MRIKNVFLGLTAAATGFVATVSTSSAAPFDPQQVPSGVKWVIHLDADATKQSTVGTAIIDEILSRPDAQQGLDALNAFAGFSVPKDVHGVTLYGKEFGEENNVIILHGTFDANRILGVLELSPSFASEAYGDGEVVSWEDKGKTMYGTFVTSDRVVIARTADSVKLAIDVFDKKGTAMAPLATDATAPGAGVLAYVEGSGIAELAKTRRASAVVGNAESAWIVIGEDADKKVFAKGHIESGDTKQSEKLLKAAEGIRAIVSLQASEETADEKVKLMDSLLTSLKLTPTSKGIDLAWQTPAATVVDAIKAQVLKTQSPQN